jgi:hypothetical protein
MGHASGLLKYSLYSFAVAPLLAILTPEAGVTKEPCSDETVTYRGSIGSKSFFEGRLYINYFVQSTGTQIGIAAYRISAWNSNGTQNDINMQMPTLLGGLEQEASIRTDECAYLIRMSHTMWGERTTTIVQKLIDRR